ncbi:MAG: hypothetical protein EOP42_33290, partial [Sphingobacteriaceae bacterium]
MPLNFKNNFPWLLVLFLAIAVQLSGINVAFFTDDPGLYAAISKNMVQRGNYWDEEWKEVGYKDVRRFLEAMKRKELRTAFSEHFNDAKPKMLFAENMHLLAKERC